MAKEKMAVNTTPCTGCEWWRKMSSYESSRACHCLLMTGVRNGKHGSKCSTYKPRRRESRDRRAFSLQAKTIERAAENEPGGTR